MYQNVRLKNNAANFSLEHAKKNWTEAEERRRILFSLNTACIKSWKRNIAYCAGKLKCEFYNYIFQLYVYQMAYLISLDKRCLDGGHAGIQCQPVSQSNEIRKLPKNYENSKTENIKTYTRFFFIRTTLWERGSNLPKFKNNLRTSLAWRLI